MGVKGIGPDSIAHEAETPRKSVSPDFDLGRWSFNPVAFILCGKVLQLLSQVAPAHKRLHSIDPNSGLLLKSLCSSESSVDYYVRTYIEPLKA